MAAAVVGVVLMVFFWFSRQPSQQTVSISKPLTAAAPRKPAPPASQPAKIAAKPAPVAPARSSALQPPPPSAAAPEVVTAGNMAVELHKDLIPKDVNIVRIYYSQEITGPATSFGLDINGSGFTSEFEKMITLDPGAKGLTVKNLRLVTANQIHGDIEVGPEAVTSYVYPIVMIKDLPVFIASKPFAVVRRGEVLSVKLTEMAEDGRSSGLRVMTNLDEKMFRQFWVESTMPGLKVSSLKPSLPYIVDGIVSITDASSGEYSLAVSIFSQEVYRESVDVLMPNLGKTGLLSDINAKDRFRRPGDRLELQIEGTGFVLEDISLLSGSVPEHDMGSLNFSYVLPKLIQAFLIIPTSAPEGVYGIKIKGARGKTLLEDQNIFTIVPALWLRGVSLEPPAAAGSRSVLKIIGRDFSAEFAASLKIEMDEPGIEVSNLRLVDESTLAADIAVGAAVAPGDYLLHLSANGKALKAHGGSIIKVPAR